MKEFPKNLKPENRQVFKAVLKRRVKKDLIKDIFMHIISSQDEKEYYSLDSFLEKYPILTKEEKYTIINSIRDDLTKLEWKTSLSYGDTALFIYKDTPPSNCY